MEFLINGDKWKIEVISNEEINKKEKNDDESIFIHGTTVYSENTIYLNEKSPNKKKSLIHELLHCYLYEYGFRAYDKQFNAEDLCEIVAGSFETIKRIVVDYFER